MTLSKTAQAAMSAVERGQAKQKEERTTEIIIRDIRRNLEASLAVTPDDVRLLLGEYDKFIGLFSDYETSCTGFVMASEQWNDLKQRLAAIDQVVIVPTEDGGAKAEYFSQGAFEAESLNNHD